MSPRFALLLLACALLCARTAGAQAIGAKEETFPAVDPYSHNDKEVLARAGYVSFGPFAWGENHDTTELSQTLGGVAILFVETAHFKLASTLKTYKLYNDPRENDLLERELKRLKTHLSRVRPATSELDPWLRLHLYAQRCEELYADFSKQFGLSDEDFPAAGASAGRVPYMGEGPYLGQTQKITVLITEKNSTLGRYVKRYFKVDEENCYSQAHSTGGWTFAISAESRHIDGVPDIDAQLHCAVVEGLVHTLINGFRNAGWYMPPWWKYGLAHWYARRVDERWQLFGKSPEPPKANEQTWIWEPRVWGLVNNKFFAPWKDMLAWTEDKEIDPRAHLVAWSRVSFLMQQGEGRHHEFLMALSDPPAESWAGTRGPAWVERQSQALKTCYGMDADALEAAWAKWVLRTYEKK